MDINVAKGIVLVGLFLLTFCFSMLPLRLVSTLRHTNDPTKKARYARVISLLSCFAGGVFMATALLDLFPEVDDTLNDALDAGNVNISFPVPEFVVVFGFFLVLITEQIVLDFKETTQTLEGPHLVDASEVPRPFQRHNSIEGISDQPQLESSQEYVMGHSQSHGIETEIPHSSFRSLLLLMSLSLHSTFEGLAIGLQPTVDAVLQVCAAVVLHKTIIAFSLGLNLVQSKLSIGAILKSNLLFCVTSPIGLGIAMGVEEFGHNVHSSAINGILQGLACGTFLYVTFFEVLPHELNHGHDRLLKLLTVLIGFSVVCGVLFLDPDVQKPRCYKEPLPNPGN